VFAVRVRRLIALGFAALAALVVFAPRGSDLTWAQRVTVAPPSEEGSASSSSPLPRAAPSVCPAGMALVRGSYCNAVEQRCLEWLETPFLPGGDGRCAVFAPSVCVGRRVPMAYCIDLDEYTEPGAALPMAVTSWLEGTKICEAEGRRLCKESEWNFACEGEEMLPYPTGLTRDSSKCNFDQMKLVGPDHKPLDLRKSSAELAQCASPFGVRSMVGNVDEWTVRDVSYGEWRSALKGGWWLPARNRCRPATTAHGEWYRDFQTGFRCCLDAPKGSEPPRRP